MNDWVKVADREDLDSEEGLCVQFEGEQVAVFFVDNKLEALEDKCPHRGGPLSEGALLNGCVICPWHAAKFETSSGKLISGPSPRDARIIQSQLRGDGVYLKK